MPPKWIDNILEFLCSDRFIDELQGDLHEIFYRNLETHSLKRAKWKYFWSVLFSVRFYRLPHFSQFIPTNMWNLHFLLAFRYAKRHKTYSLTNVFGLCLGLAAVFYISLFIKNELTYDNFHENKDELYRIVTVDVPIDMKGIRTSSQHGASIKNEFPEVKVFRMGNDPVKIGAENPVMVEDFYWADSTLLEMFSFDVLSGDPVKALTDPNSIVLTKSLSEQLFGEEDPVGKLMPVKVYDSNVDLNMKITAVVQDPPVHSHIQFRAMGAMSNAEQMYANLVRQWGFQWLRTYVQIPKEDISRIEAFLPEIFEKYMGEGTSERMGMILQPFDEIYLHSQPLEGNRLSGDIKRIYVLGTIGLMILLISIFNYINLSTAQAIQRAKEVGIRKVVGSQNRHIATQFLFESILYSLFAGGVGAMIVFAFWPNLNDIFSLEFTPTLPTFSNILIVLGGIIAIGVLAGAFPAAKMTGFGFSGFGAIKGNFEKGGDGILRNGLIGIQYVITLVLLTSTFAVYLQYQYLKNYDLGFDREQLIHIPVEDRQLQAKIMTMKAAFLNTSDVIGVTVTGENLPAAMNNTWDFSWNGLEPTQNKVIDIVGIDQDYFSVLGIPLIEGENFKKGYEADSARTFILNERAKKLMNKSSVTGNLVTIGGRTRVIGGVVKNHHFTSLHSTVIPVGYAIFPPGDRVSPDNLFLKVQTSHLSELTRELEEIWNEFSADPFEYNFVDEAFAASYEAEQKFATMITVFTILGILIAVIGLFGLMSFVIKRRLKEISIRKVLGAEVGHILRILSQRILVVFLLAFAVAWPIAFYLVNEWLTKYPYRIEFSWFMPIGAGILCLAISIAVILFQIHRAFRLNPVENLRME